VPRTGIYEIFLNAKPRAPLNAERRRLASAGASASAHEQSRRACAARLDHDQWRSHTMTTSAVVSAYHVTITRCGGASLKRAGTRARSRDGAPSTRRFRSRLCGGWAGSLVAQGDTTGPGVLATLLDLQRISLTTSPQKGAIIIEPANQVERDQRGEGIGDLPFGPN